MNKRIGSFLLALSLLGSASLAWGRDEGRSIDLRIYCRKLYGDSVGWTHVRSDAYSWKCVLGKREFPIDMNQACKLQYDDSYVAKLENPADSYTWSCSSETANPR